MCSLSQNLQKLIKCSAGLHFYTFLKTQMRLEPGLAYPCTLLPNSTSLTKEQPTLFLFLKLGPL